MRVLVLGAGFGGLELTTRLSEEFGDDVDVVLIDKNDGFVFGFSKLDVMFGRTSASAVHHPYRDCVKPGVQFVQATIRSIDPVAKHVETDAGAFVTGGVEQPGQSVVGADHRQMVGHVGPEASIGPHDVRSGQERE